MNSTEYDVRNNLQCQFDQKIYRKNNTIGFIDKGALRHKQEDSLLILKHRSMDFIQLFLIADGMGGLENGALASNQSANSIINWFSSFDFEKRDFDYMEKSFREKLQETDYYVRKECNGGGTTITCAITHLYKTLVTNVGDSRCYIYDGSTIQQITEDQNLAWKYYKENLIEKDDLRYCENNNLLTSRIGCKEKIIDINSYTIDNSSYSKILLCSDGLTDVITDMDIKEYLMDSERIDVESFLRYINNYYEKKDSISNILKRKEIIGGKDNISGIIHCRRIGK